MIIDSINNCKQYEAVHTDFVRAFDFIKRAIREDLPVGKYEIDGEKLYASVQEYVTKMPEEARFESHEKYIDIQCVISGAEAIDVVDIQKAEAETPYFADKDIVFYKNTDRGTKSVYEAGDFGIFFPHDVHKPSMACGSISASVRKIVVKIKA